VGYRLIADLTMLLHFAFLAYVVFGGFAAWWRPGLIWPHLAVAAWGLATVAFSIRCPLTDVEDWARVRAGGSRLTGTGFIDHYIENVVYPERYTLLLQGLAAVVVLVSWLGLVSRRRRRGRLRRRSSATLAGHHR
jgi:Protein of Unknown function (DUF2784)